MSSTTGNVPEDLDSRGGFPFLDGSFDKASKTTDWVEGNESRNDRPEKRGFPLLAPVHSSEGMRFWTLAEESIIPCSKETYRYGESTFQATGISWRTWAAGIFEGTAVETDMRIPED